MHITLRKPKKIIRENTFRYKLMGLDLSSPSGKTVLRAPDLRYTVAIVQLELKTRTSHTRLALRSCDFPSRAAVLRAPDLYYKIAIFQLELETCTASAGNLHFAH